MWVLQRLGTLPENPGGPSVGQKVDEGDGEGASSRWISFDVAQPPLLVFLPIDHDHLALGKRQLVRVVGYALVDGLHPLRFLLWVRLP